MATLPLPPTDPVTLVRTLDPDEIRRHLAENDHERRALLVLLRAALARKRAEVRAGQGGSHAS